MKKEFNRGFNILLLITPIFIILTVIRPQAIISAYICITAMVIIQILQLYHGILYPDEKDKKSPHN